MSLAGRCSLLLRNAASWKRLNIRLRKVQILLQRLTKASWRRNGLGNLQDPVAWKPLLVIVATLES